MRDEATIRFSSFEADFGRIADREVRDCLIDLIHAIDSSNPSSAAALDEGSANADIVSPDGVALLASVMSRLESVEIRDLLLDLTRAIAKSTDADNAVVGLRH